ncbi:MAG TPA: GspH/FimT family pseudopilin [Ramlibacter sp.]|nr:GspH/FimT family pseudopilin [Ramlibacter sp.]
MNTPHTAPSFILQQDAGRPSRSRARGFTLIEMLAVVAILGVLACVSIPSMKTAFNSIKLSSATNVFVSGLHLARSEAIKRNARVVLCKSANGDTCSTAGGWEQGWIVFHDANNNGARDPQEAIIQREQPLSASLRLTGNLNVAKYVSFVPTGATKLTGGAFQAGTLTVCRHSADAVEGRQIVLNAVGRPRVLKASLASCA